MKHGLIGTIGWLRVFLAVCGLAISSVALANQPAIVTLSGVQYTNGSSVAAVVIANGGQYAINNQYTYTGIDNGGGFSNIAIKGTINGAASTLANFTPTCPPGTTYAGYSGVRTDWPMCTGGPTPTPTPAPSCTSGTSLGVYYVAVPGFHTDSNNRGLVDDLNKARAYSAAGFPSCVDSCAAVGPPVSGDKNLYGDGTGTAFVRVQLGTTGASCTGANTASQTLSATPPPAKTPVSPVDCPTNTTFGQVNGSNICVNNGPLPSQASTPASQVTGPTDLDAGTGKTGTNSTATLPGDADGCVSGCDSLTGSGTGSGGGSGTVTIPTDYNREVTQKSIDSTNKTILQKITDFFGDGNYDKPDHVGDGYTQAAADSASGVAKAVTDTGNATTISGYSWEWNVGDYIKPTSCSSGLNIGPWIKIDWCAQVQMVRDFFGFVLYILTAYGLLALFTSKEK